MTTVISSIAKKWMPLRKACIVIFFAFLPLRPAGAVPELLDRIVAVVDNEVILWSELNLRLSLELQQQGLSFIGPEAISRHREHTLDAMIDEQIVVLKAKQDSLEIDFSHADDLLNAELGRIKDNTDPAEFESMLERTGISERQLKTRYRKQIQNRMFYEQMLGQLAYRSFITRSDVEDFRQAHADTLPAKISISQINIKVEPSAAILSGAMKKISRIQAEIDGGIDFADVAATYSEDPGTVATGGDLGCFELGMLMPEFEMAALDLKPEEISPPVRTKHGFHLIQLHDKRENELCASHILVRARIMEDDRERTLQRLVELRQRALHGEDFAQLAKYHSEDPQTARTGGLWQIVEKQQIPPFLQPYLSGLRLGEVSKPFLLDDDGHILKINDDHNTLESLVREERMHELMSKLIDELKTEIHIEKRLDEDRFLWDPAAAGTDSAPDSAAVGAPG